MLIAWVQFIHFILEYVNEAVVVERKAILSVVRGRCASSITGVNDSWEASPVEKASRGWRACVVSSRAKFGDCFRIAGSRVRVSGIASGVPLARRVFHKGRIRPTTRRGPSSIVFPSLHPLPELSQRDTTIRLFPCLLKLLV